MFRFIYALSSDERINTLSLRADEFDGYEVHDPADHGARALGRRVDDLKAARSFLDSGGSYAIYKPSGAWIEATQRIDEAMIGAVGKLLIEPWPERKTVRELWLMLESLRSKNVQIAWPAEWGAQTEQSAARVVPILNLRIGAVRVTNDSPETVEYVRRLAGIGFEGYFIADPPDGADRLGDARKIIELARDITQPRKPAKAVAKK